MSLQADFEAAVDSVKKLNTKPEEHELLKVSIGAGCLVFPLTIYSILYALFFGSRYVLLTSPPSNSSMAYTNTDQAQTFQKRQNQLHMIFFRRFVAYPPP